MKKSLMPWLTILLLMGLIVGTASAWMIGAQVKNVTLGEQFEEVEAYDLDARGILPENTVAICRIYPVMDTRTNKTIDTIYCNYYGGPSDYTFGTVYNIPMPGEYYAVQYPSQYLGKYNRSINREGLDLKKFRADNLRIFTIIPAPIPTYLPTPTPTPTIGSIKISSNPSGASIFLDNALKGITPLTLNDVTNGAHVVLLRYNGYQDYSTTVNILGDISTINPTLEKISSSTSTLTSTQTTVAPTVTTTTPQFTLTATPTTQTPIITTATPRPTSKVNYSATIATMQSQIAEQNAKIEEQGSWIDQILRFLGLK